MTQGLDIINRLLKAKRGMRGMYCISKIHHTNTENNEAKYST